MVWCAVFTLMSSSSCTMPSVPSIPYSVPMRLKSGPVSPARKIYRPAHTHCRRCKGRLLSHRSRRRSPRRPSLVSCAAADPARSPSSCPYQAPQKTDAPRSSKSGRARPTHHHTGTTTQGELLAEHGTDAGNLCSSTCEPKRCALASIYHS